MTGEYCEEDDFKRLAATNVALEDVRRMEWQANYFASCLLLPRKRFVAKFLEQLKKRNVENRGHGVLFVDRQKCNVRNFLAITDALRLEFDVSRTAVEIRLRKLGLLNDERTSMPTRL